MGHNLYQSIAKKAEGRELGLFLVGLTLLIVGLNHFAEDTLSSRYGIEWLERAFNIRVATYEFTYWTMSIANQVGQVVCGILWAFDTEKNSRYGGLAVFFFVVDLGSDVWYRSSELAIAQPATGGATAILTVLYFTLGSEFFIMLGFGICMSVIIGATVQLFVIWYTIADIWDNRQSFSQMAKERVRGRGREQKKSNHTRGRNRNQRGILEPEI